MELITPRMRLPALCFALSTAALVAADFPAPFNSGTDQNAKPPMTGEEAVKTIKLPPGFKATLFAAEPDVQNPIACAWDSRGRLWVAENYTYAEAAKGFDHSLRDRILIFEDTDNDGRHDKRTVFADNLKNLTSIELGYGGVYATAAPHLLFFPDKNRDDKPDAEPEVLLDGFDATSSRHNFVNGLKWGPDGWLYGRHGILATSHVGRPGSPDSERVKINCCIWRFHPVRKTFEVVTWGGTNPWGHDWNAEGEGFFTNTVTGHLYHIIPGAHYERMYGEDLNPHIYQLLPQTADHYHYDTSKSWTESRDGKANDFGGGHAHTGCMIYLGDNWPEQYRGKLFTINLHGRRLNVERLERKGSGYTSKHDGDLFQFADPWFRGIDLTYGPDGGVYILDWSDQGECHENDGVHRTSGRIYKITHGEVKKGEFGEKGDLFAWPDEELIDAAILGGEWFSRMVRPILAGRLDEENIWKLETFRKLLIRQRIENARSAGLPFDAPLKEFEETRITHLRVTLTNSSRNPIVWNRAFQITTLEEDPKSLLRYLAAAIPEQITEGVWLPASEPAHPLRRVERVLTDPIGRRLAAAMLSRYPLASRSSGIAALLDVVRDPDDPLVASLLWSAMEPLATSNPSFARIAFQGEIPKIWRFAARRLASEIERSPGLIDEMFELGGLYFGVPRATEIVRGTAEALRGRTKVTAPPHWVAFAAKAQKIPALADDIRKLNVIFGDGRALEEIREIIFAGKDDLQTRRQALETLIASKPADLRKICEKLVNHGDLNAAAMRGLATFEDPAAAKLAVDHWNNVRSEFRAGVISTFVSRPTFARALLAAIAAGKIPRESVTPYHARQIAAFNDPDLTVELSKVWGEIRTTPAAKQQRMTELKTALAKGVIAKADIERGRQVFTQTCAACHRLYDLGAEGTQLGPNLTGSGRENIDYLLENIIDPNALVPADYKLSILTMKDGRTLSGFISAQTDQTLTLRTMTDTQTLPKADVAKSESSPNSLMPEALLDALNPEQIRDLFGFLMKK
jgi:putative membrane-bound dehydrogenase-like protein